MKEKLLDIEIEGTSIKFHYSESIKNEKAPFLLVIGGWQSNKEIFFELLEELNLNAIVFDYPGIGSNSKILYKLHKIVEFWEEKLIYTKNFINNLRNIIITKVITLYNLI